jgi:hypothetical protein
MVELSENILEIVGISSFGDASGCAGAFAGVYADLTQSLPWIWSVINKSGVCPRP